MFSGPPCKYTKFEGAQKHRFLSVLLERVNFLIIQNNLEGIM